MKKKKSYYENGNEGGHLYIVIKIISVIRDD